MSGGEKEPTLQAHETGRLPPDDVSVPDDVGEERWGSRLGVILAVAGSAVGLGNFLRFPGQAVEHGGGAFMIPYFVALLLLGVPIGWVEWTMARYGGERGFHSSPGVMGVVGRGRVARYTGVLGVLIPLVIYMYYVVIESWCLRYAWEYLVLGEGLAGSSALPIHSHQAEVFFQSVSGANRDGALLSSGLNPTLSCWVIVGLLNFWFVSRGLSQGVELVCRWAMPAMAVCALLVLGRVLTLGTPDPRLPAQSVLGGLGFLWNPDLSQLGSFKTWLAAAGQVFFSLSVGFGVIINYASYLKRQDDVVLSGLTAAATNEVFEVAFGGLITVTAAFVFLGASGVAGGTFGLGFQTLPIVFSHMGGAGRLVGLIWFLMLFLAAITSSLSMLQPVVAFLEEALGLRRGPAALLTSGVAGGGSVWVVYFSRDLVALDTMDFWVGTFAIFIFATAQVLCFGWVLGVDRGLREAHEGACLRIPVIYRVIIKYVAPIYLVVILVGFVVESLPEYWRTLLGDPTARHTGLLMAGVLALLVAVTVHGERRWRRLGLDLDGRGDGSAPMDLLGSGERP